MKIYLQTPKIHCIEVDNVDEAIELIKKLSEEESKVDPYKDWWKPTLDPYYITINSHTI